MNSRFYVVRINADDPTALFAADRHGDMTAYALSQGETHNISGDTMIIGLPRDDEKYAEQVAQFLAKRYPQNSYAVVETKSVYFTEPGEIRKAAHTDKGFFPV